MSFFANMKQSFRKVNSWLTGNQQEEAYDQSEDYQQQAYGQEEAQQSYQQGHYQHQEAAANTPYQQQAAYGQTVYNQQAYSYQQPQQQAYQQGYQQQGYQQGYQQQGYQQAQQRQHSYHQMYQQPQREENPYSGLDHLATAINPQGGSEPSNRRKRQSQIPDNVVPMHQQQSAPQQQEATAPAQAPEQVQPIIAIAEVYDMPSCLNAMQYIKQGAVTIVTMRENQSPEDIRRLTDLLTGAVYVLGSQINRLSNSQNYFVISPKTYQVGLVRTQSAAQQSPYGHEQSYQPAYEQPAYRQQPYQQAPPAYGYQERPRRSSILDNSYQAYSAQ